LKKLSLTDDQKKFINFNAAIFKTLSDFEKLYKDVEPKNGEYEIHTNFDGTVTIIIPSIK